MDKTYSFLEDKSSILDDSSIMKLDNSGISLIRDYSREEENKTLKTNKLFSDSESYMTINSFIEKNEVKKANNLFKMKEIKTFSEKPNYPNKISNPSSKVDMMKLQLNENKQKLLRLRTLAKGSNVIKKDSDSNFIQILGDVLLKNCDRSALYKNRGKSINKNKISQENYVIEEEDSFEKLKSSRVFWSKEKLQQVRKKLLEYKELIKKKTTTDFDDLRQKIMKGESEKVLKIMHDPVFKKFYKLNLMKSDILEFTIKSNQTKILMDVLKDDFYKFNRNLIFEFIIKYLKEFYYKYQDDIRIISDIINNQLYNTHHVKMIAWYLSLSKQYDLFRVMLSNESSLKDLGNTKYDQFKDDNCIQRFYETQEVYHEVLSECFEYKFEDLATATVNYTLEFQNEELICKAVTNSCTSFLKFVWELCFIESKSYNSTSAFSIKSFKNEVNSTRTVNIYSGKNINSGNSKNSQSSKNFYGINKNFNNGNIPFSLTFLIDKFCEMDKKDDIKDIIYWRYIEKDENFLEKLFEKKCFDEISTLIYKKNFINKWKLNKEQFKIVIEQEEFDLILFFLNIKSCIMILQDSRIQALIVKKYIKSGSKLYYGAEMLSFIYKLSWKSELTKTLCYNIQYTIRKREIVNCHSPILTCLLLAEFLTLISEVNISHNSHCLQIVKDLIELSKHIQNSSQDEVYIKFLMSQKDTKGRSAFQIASDNNFFSLLQIEEIGTIIGKKWNGKISHNGNLFIIKGFFSVSSLHRFLKNNSNISQDPLVNFDRIDREKTYFYQLSVWTDSCSLRFIPESISLITYILIYNLYIYLLVSRNIMMIPYRLLLQDNFDTLILLHIYSILSIIYAINIFNQVLFCHLTKRRVRIDFWQISDILVLGFVYLLYLDFPKMYNEDYRNPSNLAKFSRAVILCINNFFVWIRIVGILITFKKVGPLIRMIFKMSAILVKYIVLYGLFVICNAAIFYCIFYKYNNEFTSFSESVFFLIGGFIQNFDLKTFKNYVYFGEILLGLFITISGILLINLLIAMLNSIYDSMNSIVDASHRAVLISYYEKYKWNEKYGYLIFLSTPLNILNWITFPISHFLISNENRKDFNVFVLKVYYLFYFSIIFCFYLIYSILLIPFCYLKGIVTNIRLQLKYRINHILKLLNLLKWISIGIPFLFYIYLCDIYDILTTLYIKSDKNTNEVIRLKNLISTEDVVIFLQFIHGKKGKDPVDLHLLFQEYLSFEQMIKAEKCERLKEQSKYIREMMKHHSKKSRKTYTTLMVFNKEDHNTNITGNYTKKNLIIIEILENFKVDNYYANSHHLVDIEKIRMLLPKTLNIDSHFIKRLLHTDISYMNKAINNLKIKKDIFQQYLLVNRILSSSIRIDKLLDDEVNKIYRRRFYEHVTNGNSEESDDFQNLINYYLTIDNKLEMLCDEFKLKMDNIENIMSRGSKAAPSGGVEVKKEDEK